MIVYYEDEETFVAEYVKVLRRHFDVEVFDSAEALLKRTAEVYADIQLFIVDLMVFGPGNRIGPPGVRTALRNGLLLLDRLEEIEAKHPDIEPKQKIVLTNRKGGGFEEARSDPRIARALKKSSTLPSELLNIVNSIVGTRTNGDDA